jgi:hypothetical protein
VPSGIWAAEEYAKLRRYDAPTGEQPPQVFLCHTAPGRVCAGWAGCHDGAHLLALRFAAMTGSMSPVDIDATIGYVSPVLLFGSGGEAADHGEAEIAEPGPRAVAAVEKVIRVRADLVHINDLKPITARRYRVCGEEEQ